MSDGRAWASIVGANSLLTSSLSMTTHDALPAARRRANVDFPVPGNPWRITATGVSVGCVVVVPPQVPIVTRLVVTETGSRGNSEHRTATESPKRAFVGLPICHTSTPREMRVSYTSILVKIGEKTRRRPRRRGSTLPLGRPRSTARGSDSPPTVRLPSSTSLSLSLSSPPRPHH